MNEVPQVKTEEQARAGCKKLNWYYWCENMCEDGEIIPPIYHVCTKTYAEPTNHYIVKPTCFSGKSYVLVTNGALKWVFGKVMISCPARIRAICGEE